MTTIVGLQPPFCHIYLLQVVCQINMHDFSCWYALTNRQQNSVYPGKLAYKQAQQGNHENCIQLFQFVTLFVIPLSTRVLGLSISM